MTDTESETIDRYLLGQLPEAECHRLEERLLADPELFETAEAAEDELIDRYARGEMEPDERRQLERRLLGSERIRERIAFAKALAARTAALRDDPRPAAEVLPRRRRLGWGSTRLAWAATLILAVAVAWSTAGVLRLRSDLGRTRSDLAASRSATERAQTRADDLEHAAARATTREEDLRQQLATARATAQTRIAELEKRQLAGTELRVRRPGGKGKKREKVQGALPQVSLFLPAATRGAGGESTLHLDAVRQVELELDLGGLRPPEDVRVSVTHPQNGQAKIVWSQSGLAVESLEGEMVGRLLKPPRIAGFAPPRAEASSPRA
jgi:anti-sigma factor RsiW